jgi:hypothetical protein
VLVAQLAGRNPTLWQGSATQQNGQSLGIERVSLVRLAHALLGFERVGQVRTMAGLLHQIDDPVPVAGGLDGDLGFAGQGVEIAAIAGHVVLDAHRLRSASALINRDKDREMLMRITSQELLHDRSSLMENVAQLA